MVQKTILIYAEADTWINNVSPTHNYGSSDHLKVGFQSSVSMKQRSLIRFKIPKFVGEIVEQRIALFAGSMYGTGPLPLGVHIVDSPQDDLWIEGISNGAVDAEGASWNEYARHFPWDAVGGDFDGQEIALKLVPHLYQYHTIYVLSENFEFVSGKSHTIMLKSALESTTNDYIYFYSRTHSNEPRLYLVVEIEGLDTPTLTAEPISSTQLDISWDKSQLADDNFTHYLLEQSDTGIGGWTTLATITDKDTVKHEHTSLVVQGDVNDYNEDSDTYPNGRTKYYRMSVISSVFGATGYGTADATTIPAIRPISLTFNPRSKFWDADFIDDNCAYKPYGVEVIPSWYDSLDITEENYIDKLTVGAYFRGASTWPGAASETNDFSPVNFIAGGIVEGDSGYKPYKIKGKIYDTGGLYRKATTDKTNEQFDVAWPAPCPVALPDGPYATAPPAMNGRPFSADSLVPVDLSVAGQQVGEDIFVEDFVGTPDDTGKWKSTVLFVPTPLYGTGVGGLPTIESKFNNAGNGLMQLQKRVLGETTPTNKYNKYLSKYTGGYKCRCIFRFDINWNLIGGATHTEFLLNFVRWPASFPSGGGYYVIFDTNNTNMVIFRHGNFLVTSQTLATISLGADAPLQNSNKEKFVLVEVVSSPYFNTSNEGDTLLIIYNIANTYNDVININYDTHPYTFVINSLSHGVGEQPHYTGDIMTKLSTNTPQTNADFEIYDVSITGRVNGQGYGAKNLTHDQILGLVASSIPTFPITCAPDQASQICKIEGRIKNEYGAQSRTGEVDDYQGDTFNNAIPIGFLSVPKTGFVGSDVLIDASQSIDPEGGSLIYKYDFGDTETLETSQSSVSHQYASPGTYTVKLIVEDEAGLLSVEVQSIITIYDAVAQFEEVSLMSPWESINEGSPSGTSSTSHPELDYDTIQTMEGGNRVFGLTGQHHDPNCNTALATRITNAENEKDYFHVLYNQAKLITLDLVNFGKVRGVITDHKPSMAVDDQQAFQFSMTFQEIDVRQFE